MIGRLTGIDGSGHWSTDSVNRPEKLGSITNASTD
jgi:hypothetical protein